MIARIENPHSLLLVDIHCICVSAFCTRSFLKSSRKSAARVKLTVTHTTLSPSLSCSLSHTHTHQYIADYNRDLCQTSPILSPCVGDVSWTETSGGESEQIVSVFLFPLFLSPLSHRGVARPWERE